MAGEHTDKSFHEVYQLASDLSDITRVGKEAVLNVPIIRDFDITGFDQVDVVHGRLQFPQRTPKNLAFAPDRLLVAIMSGDFVDTGSTDNESLRIAAYYPHERNNQLVGRTVFTMTLEDAARLLERCGIELTGNQNHIRRALSAALQDYQTRMTFFTPEDWELHKRDIASALQQLFTQ